jgi:hypothetical protein
MVGLVCLLSFCIEIEGVVVQESLLQVYPAIIPAVFVMTAGWCFLSFSSKKGRLSRYMENCEADRGTSKFYPCMEALSSKRAASRKALDESRKKE